METEPLTIREASPADWPEVERWARAHNRGRFDSRMIPPTSFTVEDGEGPLAFCSLYLSLGVGVAFLEGMFSRPGATAQTVLEGMAMLTDTAREVCRLHDYGLLMGLTHPGIARKARSLGFEVGASGLTQIVLTIPRKEAA